MSFEHFSGIGIVHLNVAKAPKVVPSNERHKWAKKIAWGEQTTCVKCGCVKRRRYPQYTETYQMKGGEETNERPACTGEKLQETR